MVLLNYSEILFYLKGEKRMQGKKSGTKTLKTERLILRKILPSDYFSTVKWYCDPEIAKFSMSRKPPSKRQVARFTCGRIRQYPNKAYYNWAIVYQGKMRGYIELLPVRNNDRLYSVSYKLDMSLKNQGIVTEALKAVIDYSSTQGLKGLLGFCDIENIGSKRVMEKAGMTRFGDPETDKPLKYTDGTEGKKLSFKIKF